MICFAFIASRRHAVSAFGKERERNNRAAAEYKVIFDGIVDDTLLGWQSSDCEQ